MYKLTKRGIRKLKINKYKKNNSDVFFCDFPFIIHTYTSNPFDFIKRATIELNTLNVIEYDEEVLDYLIKKNMVEKVEGK